MRLRQKGGVFCWLCDKPVREERSWSRSQSPRVHRGGTRNGGRGRQRHPGDGRRLDKHFVIEHDRPLSSHPDEEFAEYITAAVSIDYLRKVRW